MARGTPDSKAAEDTWGGWLAGAPCRGLNSQNRVLGVLYSIIIIE